MSIESLLLQKVLDKYVTDAQKANFASMMAPGAGYLDAAGQFPSPGGEELSEAFTGEPYPCLLYTSPSPRDRTRSRMPSSA